jgi:hypothetical protein
MLGELLEFMGVNINVVQVVNEPVMKVFNA